MNKRFLTMLTLAALGSGCVTHTVVRDEPRQHVRFGSRRAAETFYNAYLAHTYRARKGSWDVYLLPPYTTKTIATDNVYFNAAIRPAQPSESGVISEREAAAYAVKVASE